MLICKASRVTIQGETVTQPDFPRKGPVGPPDSALWISRAGKMS
jgi:hypothetical protein